MKIYYNNRLNEFARENRNKPTLTEKILWRYLKGGKMKGYDFHRQKPMGNYIADFYCYKLRLVIELDGYTHTFEDVIDKDKRKQCFIENLDFVILRFRDEEVLEDVQNVLSAIEKYIEEFEMSFTPKSPQGDLTRPSFPS